MADLHHWWKDVFQAAGTTQEWLVTGPEREHYWGISYRPFQANERAAEIVRHFITSDNNLTHTDHLFTSVMDGNIYRLSLIWVVGA